MHYDSVRDSLRRQPRTWLVTGAAGFIGSNLLEELLRLGQTVVGLDSFATGHRRNLDEAVAAAGEGAADRFTFVEGDIRDLDACRQACEGVDLVLHQAALGSVPRSIKDPLTTHAVNVDGTLHMLTAARDAGVGRFVYASSSSVYGDHPGLPKVEGAIGTPLSPYAVSKRVCELYARTFQDHYGLETVGLRYFNVFGPRQDPDGPYAAVIPRWMDEMLDGRSSTIFGDGETSRDFCYVANVVQANVLAGRTASDATGTVYNIAVGDRTTLNDLFREMSQSLVAEGAMDATPEPAYADFRPGDVRHSLADTSAAHQALGYRPTHPVGLGLRKTVAWYVQDRASASS
ncbi:SDR family oxidoreductase [Rubrivirga marina]|uniref:LPS biosynthesis protein WbpP n=1 Tax=Rubrivirga marina TaxID=1196024 RepID=A0A271IZ88_9BACT|nr:SDR family oxidoreductase [Rubrivirga marina]PAP76387.1 LPS biosynthesis protein WbpP [Rubrivirga marina]